MIRRLPCFALLALCACASAPSPRPAAPQGSPSASQEADWYLRQDEGRREGRSSHSSGPLVLAQGQQLLQGYLGAMMFDTLERVDAPGSSEPQDLDLDQMPLIGGGGMWAMNEGRITVGPEAGIDFGFRSSGGAFVSTGGGAAVAVDIDLLLVNLYAGLFANTFLGQKWRVYVGAGPLLQFADYEQAGESVADDGSGFGVGYYVRTGLEYMLPNRWMVGVGGRWIDSEIDLSGELGDLEVQGTQLFLSVTNGF